MVSFSFICFSALGYCHFFFSLNPPGPVPQHIKDFCFLNILLNKDLMQTKEGGRIFRSLEREKESSVKGLFIQVPGQFGRFDNLFPLAGFCK